MAMQSLSNCTALQPQWHVPILDAVSILQGLSKTLTTRSAEGSVDDLRQWGIHSWRWYLIALERIIPEEEDYPCREWVKATYPYPQWPSATMNSHGKTDAVLGGTQDPKTAHTSANEPQQNGALPKDINPSPPANAGNRLSPAPTRSSTPTPTPSPTGPSSAAATSPSGSGMPEKRHSARLTARQPLPSASSKLIDKPPRRPAKRPRLSAQRVFDVDEPEPKKTRFDHQYKTPYSPYDLGRRSTLQHCTDSHREFEELAHPSNSEVTEEQYKGLDCLLFRDLQSEQSFNNFICHVMAFSNIIKAGPRKRAMEDNSIMANVPAEAQDLAKQCRTFVTGFWDIESREPLTAIDQLRHYYTLYASHETFQKIKKDFEEKELHPERHQWLSSFADTSQTRGAKQVTLLNRALEAMLGFPHETQTKGSTRLTRHLNKCHTVHMFVTFCGGPGSLLLLVPPIAVRQRKIHNVFVNLAHFMQPKLILTTVLVVECLVP